MKNLLSKILSLFILFFVCAQSAQAQGSREELSAPTEITASSTATLTTFDITSNTTWQLTLLPGSDWVTNFAVLGSTGGVSPIEGDGDTIIVITHEAGAALRVATFTLSARDVLVDPPADIKITLTQQAPIDPLFSILYTQSISASSDATETTYPNAEATGNWRFSLSSGASWITNISVAGSPGHPYAINGRYGTDIRITHTANTTSEVREATFTYVDENDFYYYTITLRQEAGDTDPVATVDTITTQTQVNALSIERFTFDGDLIIESAQVDSITDLSPLSNITEVTGDVIIDGGAAADGLTSLKGLRQLQTIGGSFTISNHSALTALDTFPSLQSIGGSFRVFGNSVLTNLGGFANLTNIGSAEEMFIVDTLIDVTRMGSADEELPSNSIGFKENISLFIMSNPLLEDCCVLTSFFAGATHAVSGEIRIGNNAIGCSGEGRIGTSCSTLTLTSTDIEASRAVNTIYTANVNATAQTLSVGVNVDNSATGWRVSTTENFITFSDITGMGDGTLDIRIAENTDIKRSATITFTPTGGGNPNVRFLVITQEAAFPTLTISSPTHLISPGVNYTTNVNDTAQTIAINIALGGSAVTWVATSDTAAGFIRLPGDSLVTGIRDDTLDVMILANTTLGERSDTIIFAASSITTEGDTAIFVRILEVTQVASSTELPTIDLSGTGITAPSGSETNYTTNVNDTAQTLSVNIDIGGSTTGWTVSKISDVESVVTLPTTTIGVEDDTVDIIIAANTSTERSATIIFTSTGDEGNPVIRTFVITQKAGPATLMLSSIRESGEFTQGGDTIISNIDTDDNINYTASVGPMLQTLDVTVDIGGSVTGWEVSKSEDADFISLVMRDDRVGITIAANSTIEKRSATLTFTSTGDTENTITRYLEITQTEGYPTLTLSSTLTPFSVVPDDTVDYTLNVDSSSQAILVNIDLGGSAERWSVDGIRDGMANFISFSDTTGTEDKMVTFRIESNRSAEVRSALITFLATGNIAESETVIVENDTVTFARTITIARTVRITQLAGNVQPPTLTLSGEGIILPPEDNPNHTVNVPVEEDTLTVDVVLGGSATGWMVSKTLDIENFITLPETTMGMGNDTVAVGIAIAENPTTEKRSATITFTSTSTEEDSGNPIIQTLVITQEGITPTPTLTLTSPNNVRIPNTATDSLDPIEITFIVENGATGWMATLSGSQFIRNLDEEELSGNAGLDTIKAYAIANTGAERTATFTLTTIGDTGPADSRTITIKQEMGTPLTLSIFSNVDFRRGEESDTVIADATTTTFAVNIDIGGGAMGWEAAETSDLDNFITLPENSGGVDGRLVIMMDPNADNTDRTATITFTTTGDEGDPITRTLVITQKRPLLLLSPNTIMLGAANDTTITVSIDIDEERGVTGWEAKEMLGLTNFVTLSENSEGVADGTLDIMVKANNLDIERETRVIFIPKGVGGGIDTVTFIDNVMFADSTGVVRPRRIELVLYLPTRKMGMDTTIELNTQSDSYLILYDRIEAFLKRRSYTRGENIISPILVIRQEANPNHTLDISSPDVDLRMGEESDTVILGTANDTTFTVSVDIGGGATGWKVKQISDRGQVMTFPALSVGDLVLGDGTLEIMIKANNINRDHTFTIIFATTGEMGNPMERTLVIRQAPPTLDFSSPDVTIRKGEESDTAIVDATEQSVTINIALGGSAASWEAIGTSNFISLDNVMNPDRDTVGIDDDGTLDIRIAANPSTKERRDTITFVATIQNLVTVLDTTVLDTVTHTRTLIITQLASDFPTLTILGDTLSTGGIRRHTALFEGGVQTFTVAIDIGSSFENWKIGEVDEDEFVTLSNTAGAGNGEVEFTLSNNESTTFRTATITFTFTGGSLGNSVTQTLEIFQYQNLLTLSGTGIESLSGDEKYHRVNLDYRGRMFDVSITLDDLISDWQIASNDNDRFVILPESTTGTGNGEVTFRILNNSSTTDNRADTITFEGTGEGIEIVTRRFLVIEQEVSPPLDIENRDVTYEAGSVDIEITTGTPSTTWNVNTTASSVTSLTFTPTGGGTPVTSGRTLRSTGSGTLRIAYSENITNRTRKSTITWEALDGTGMIEIIIAQVGSPVYTGNRILTNQEQVNNIRNILGSATVITGNLIIGASSDITHLDSLYFLTEITGDFAIGQNGNTSGVLNGNSALVDIGDFPFLQKIGGGYYVTQNTNLVSGGNFPVLESIGGYFFIRDNDKLESVGTFPRLKSIGTYFSIRSNEILPSLYDFPALTSIGTGSAWVPSSNSGNGSTLNDVSIVVENNDSLKYCCVLRNFLLGGSNNAASGGIYIGNGNAVGCNSTTEITEAMCPPTIILESADTVKIANTATTSNDSIAITFIVSGSATGWMTGVDEDFITLGKSMGSAGLDTIKVSVSENGEILSRMGTIEITTMGDGDPVKTTVVITQSGIPPTLMLTSNDIVSVGASATSTDSIAVTFTVGGGATGWNATILEESPFITLSDSAASEDSGTIKVAVTENTGFLSRMNTIEITTVVDGDPVKATVVITQAAGRPFGLSLASKDRDTIAHDAVSASDIMFTVGGEVVDRWTAAVMDGDNFLTLNPSEGDVGAITIGVFTLEKNRGEERTNTIVITVVGGTEVLTDTIKVTQEAVPTIEVTDPMITIDHDVTNAQTITFNVGGSATGWKVSSDDDFVTLLSPPSGISGEKIEVMATFMENTGVARTSTITISTTGQMGGEVTEEVTVTQRGAPPVLSLNSKDRETAAYDGTTVFDIKFTVGGGAKRWIIESDNDNVSISGNNGFLTLKDAENSASYFRVGNFFIGDPGKGDYTISVTADENTGKERVNSIVIMTEGGTGVRKETIIVTQEAVPTIEFITFSDTIINYDVVDPQTITFNVGGSATGWKASSEDDFITSLSPTMGDTSVTGEVKATLTKNNGVERTATITISAEGQLGSPLTAEVTITQEGAPPILEVSVPTLKEGSDTTIAHNAITNALNIIELTLSGGATGWKAKVIDEDKFLTLVDSVGNAGTGTIRVTADENTGEERIDSIVITTEGGTGEAATDTITITQEAVPTIELITFSDTTINYDVTAEQTITFNVGGSATGWKVSSEDDFIMLLSPTMDDNSHTGEVKATLMKNNGVERTATITISTMGQLGNSVTKKITITQEGASLSLEVSIPNLKLGSDTTIAYDATTDALNITFTVGGGTGWKAKVIDEDKFLILVDSAGNAGTNIIRVTAAKNIDKARIDTIVITTVGGTEVLTDTIIVTQAAGPPISLISDNSVDVAYTATTSSDSIEIRFVVRDEATGWKAKVDEDFVTLGDTMGSSGTDTLTLKASVTANTGVERTATITLMTIDGTGTANTTITLTQAAGLPTIMLTSENTVDVLNTETALSDSIEITFVVGGGATGWTAAVDADFVTLDTTMGSLGTDTLTLKASVTANTGIKRTAKITLTATTESTEKVDTTIITITQAAGPPTLTLSRTTANVDAMAQTLTVGVTLGGSAESWDVTVTDNDFIGTLKVGDDSLRITISENSSTASREATLTFTTAGAVPQTLVITQAVGPPTLTLSRTTANVDAMAQMLTVGVTLGGSAEGWKVTETDDDENFITTSKVGDDSLRITILENSSTASREATLTFTTAGAVPQTLVITQAVGPPTLTLSRTTANVDAMAQMLTVGVTLGGSAESWDVTVTDNDFIGTLKVGDDSLRITISENSSTASREATLTFTTAGAVPQTLVITQAVGPPTLTLSRTTANVDAMAQMLTVGVTLGGSAESWDVTVTDNDFIGTLKVGDDSLRITISENSSTASREATLTFTTAGAVPQTLVITQAVGPPTLTLSRTTANVDAMAQMLTVGVTLGGSAESWDVTVTDNDFIGTLKVGDDSLRITISENSSTASREATLTFTTAGAVPQTLVITQAVGPPTLTLSRTTANVDAMAQMLTVGVTLGGSAESWDVTVTDNDFITTTKVGDDSLRITILENSSTTDPREATLTFTTTGGTGEAKQTLVITQSASGVEPPTLTLSRTTANVDAMAQMLTVGVTLGGSAESWDVTVTDNDFIGTLKVGDDSLRITISENSSTASREATLTFTTEGADSQTLVITQAGGVPTLSITGETSLSVDSAAGTANIKIMSNTDWRVTTAALFVDSLIFTPTEGSVVTAVPVSNNITLEGTGSGTLSVVYKANTEARRVADITLTRTGGTDIDIAITQAAGPPTIMLTSGNTVDVSNTATTSSDSIAIMFVVGGGATGWTAEVDEDFVTLDTTMGSLGTDTLTLKAAVKENTGVERTAVITLTATTKGTEKAETTIMIKQGGAPPTLEVAIPTPKSGSDTTIAYDATTLNVMFTVGGGATGWVALSIDGDTLKSGNAGTGTINVSFDKNTGGERMDTVVITTEGGTGDAADTVIVTQEAVPTIKVTSSTGITIDHNITAEQIITFDVGGSAKGWKSSIAYDPILQEGMEGFITLDPDDSVQTGPVMVMATPMANTSVRRSATITFITTGQLGDSVTAEVTITQNRAPGSALLDIISPSNDERDTVVAYTATTDSDSVEIVFKVEDAMGWESMISYGTGVDGFVTLSDTVNDAQKDTVRIKAAVTKNEGVERSATITLSTTGQSGNSATSVITIVQSGAPPTLTESGDTTIAYNVTATDTLDVITFEVGGGATGWEAKVIDGDKFLTLVDSKGDADTGTIRVTATGNTGEERMDTIVITTEGGTGEVTDTIVVMQEAIPTIEITVPIDKMITINYDVTDVQTITFNVGGSAKGWTASSDQDFVKLDTMGSSDTGIEVTATPMENTETTARTATITITTTGQLGASVTEEVTITQSKAPTVLVDPHTLVLTSGNTVDVANTATVSTDSIEIRFVVGGEATGWMAAVDEDFVTLDTTMGPSGTDTLTLKAAVTANTGIERTAIITLTTTGTGTAIDTTIMIKQAAGSPTLTLISGDSVAVAKTATASADSIEIMFVVGGESTGWTAAVDEDFVTLDTTMGSSGMDTLTLKAAVTENTGAARTATVTITTTGQLGDSVTAEVTITQATGIVPPVSNPPTLILTSGNAVAVTNAATVPADSIEIMFTVGGGATGWTAAVNPTFVTLGKTAGSSGTGTVTLKAAVTANAEVEARTATITLTTIGGGTAVDTTITITQAGTPLGVPTQTPLAIYPNPVGNTLTIEGASTSLQISIMDFSGRQVVYSELSTGQNTLDVADLPSGLYVIIVHGEEGEVFTGQIFKK